MLSIVEFVWMNVLSRLANLMQWDLRGTSLEPSECMWQWDREYTSSTVKAVTSTKVHWPTPHRPRCIIVAVAHWPSPTPGSIMELPMLFSRPAEQWSQKTSAVNGTETRPLNWQLFGKRCRQKEERAGYQSWMELNFCLASLVMRMLDQD